MSNNHNYLCSKGKKGSSFYEGEESPSNLSKTDLDFLNMDSPKKKVYQRQGSMVSDFTINLHRESNPYPYEGNIDLNSIHKIEFDKLKEDYFSLYEEKKYIENQLFDHIQYKSRCSELSTSINNLQIQFDQIISKSNIIQEEKISLQERFNKISKENFELVQNINGLKETLNSSEKDKNLMKTKISVSSNKIKFFEKEINSMRKKNQSMNYQIKDLKEKIKDEQDDKFLLEKRYDEQIQEMENKLMNLEGEKQKILKDSVSHLMNTLSEEQCIEFSFNKESNKIEIFFDKAKICEADNKQDNQIFTNENSMNNSNIKISNTNNINSSFKEKNLMSPTSVKKLTSEKENSILYLNTETTNLDDINISSPLKSNRNTKSLNKSRKISNNTTNKEESSSLLSSKQEITNTAVSLNKLFGNTTCNNSKSSKKLIIENKENIPFFNPSPSPTKKIHISNLNNLSSNKKSLRPKKEFSKLDIDQINLHHTAKHINSVQFINPFSFNTNTNSSIDNCIRKTQVQKEKESFRYVLSSTTNRHKKIISLDEALGENDNFLEQDFKFKEKENFRFEQENLFKMAKRLSFLSVEHTEFEIYSRNQYQEKNIIENKEIKLELKPVLACDRYEKENFFISYEKEVCENLLHLSQEEKKCLDQLKEEFISMSISKSISFNEKNKCLEENNYSSRKSKTLSNNLQNENGNTYDGVNHYESIIQDFSQKQ